ncbi:MAG TPA: winged helix-turn-helix transcriptional regulator [Candidatus Thermoplasmatota archaeon]|nr:winged helix-turn-helix transcriptional regulator [Candidatus Thermoplasmatota archaeon]
MVALALLVLPLSTVEVSATNPVPLPVLDDSLQFNTTLHMKNYTAIVMDPTLNRTTIRYQGSSKTVVELPKESIVVVLPDNRLAITYPSAVTSILPAGSTVSYLLDNPVVNVPQQSRALGVSKVVVSPLTNFTAKSVFYQSIHELDSYHVQAIFFQLIRDTPEDPLVSYMIDWGDGKKETYLPTNVSVSHVYHSSGDYTVMINASDQLGFTYVTSQTLTVNYEGGVAHSYLWAQKNKGPVAIATTTGLGLLLIGLVAFTESGKYRLLMLFTLMIPLYTRIQKEDVLDQFVRGQIYGYIKTNPGAHYNQILRQVGVKNGTLSYHLGVLEKTQLIQSRREGLKYRAFYPTGMMFPKEERFRLTELQIQIIAHIKGRPGLTQKEIARLLGQKPQTINYNIKVLAQAGLIHVTKKGRKTRCFPVPDSGVSVQ